MESPCQSQKQDSYLIISSMARLKNWNAFLLNVKEDKQIPTIIDLLNIKDILLFARSRCLLEVSLSVATQTARPPTIFLTGEVHHGFVSSVGVTGDEYGYHCSILKALS